MRPTTDPRDTSVEQFEPIRCLLDQAKRRIKPRTVDLYEVFCIVLYPLWTMFRVARPAPLLPASCGQALSAKSGGRRHRWRMMDLLPRAMPPSLFTRRLILTGLFAFGVITCLPVHAQTAVGGDALVAAAQALVDRLDLADTGYEHGVGRVVWTPPVASYTDCSGFIDHLLAHVDGYDADDFRRWFGKRRPTADHYHDAIAQGRGFMPLTRVDALRPGDLIAIKYLVPRKDTGHIMVVADTPRPLPARPPVIDGTTQWSVAVIDSAESGHGPQDTRYRRGEGGRDHPGLGRGVFRLYTDAQGQVAGFSWSTLKVSRFVPPREEHVSMGRWIPGFRPPP